MQPAKRIRRRPVEDLRSMLLRALENGGSALSAFKSGVFPHWDLLDWYGVVRTETDPDGPIHRYIRENNIWMRIFDLEYGAELIEQDDGSIVSMSEFFRSIFNPVDYPYFNPLWGVLSNEVISSAIHDRYTRFMLPNIGSTDRVEITTANDAGITYYLLLYKGVNVMPIFNQMRVGIPPNQDMRQNDDDALIFYFEDQLELLFPKIYELFRHGLRLTHVHGLSFGLNNQGLSCKICNQITVLQCPETKEMYCSEQCHSKAGCYSR